MTKVCLADDLFISPLSPNESWVLGLLLTDGCVYTQGNNCYISICSIDKDIIEKIKDIMMCGNITFMKGGRIRTKDPEKDSWKWRVCSKGLYERLSFFGMTPRKTMILEFPNTDVLSLPDFVRGAWDGDGSISIGTEKRWTTKKKILSASFGCASLSFIQALWELLKPVTKSQSNIYVKNEFGHINYTGVKAISLLEWIYKDSSESNRMNRKYDKYLDYLRKEV